MLHAPTPSETKYAKRHRDFHASISERAAQLKPPPVRAPYVSHKQSINPAPYWRDMWFYALVRFGETYVPGVQVPRQYDVKNIQRAVAVFYGVTVADMLSARRTSEIILPRHVAIYLTKELTGKALPEIGRRFGNRDHTSILFAIRKIQRLIKIYPELASDVARITVRVKDEAL